ncbi:adenosine receptor A1-like [Hoplias malabaricus]|uniref:adenosine receptor A1-like n=1 Tax=Hoplias malabaricus TaxID=27720 RepID=UPI0034629F5B
MTSNAKWWYILTEVVIAVACCLGNVLVIWAVWTRGALRQPTFCFIASLAVADFLVGCVVIPLSMLVDIRMKISVHGCLCMCCVLVVLQMASVNFLLVIAIDRYLRVRIPLTYKSTVTQKRSWIAVVFCWLTAAVWGFIPMFGWHKYNSSDKSSSFECSFLSVISTSYLVNFIFFSSVLPPFAVMTFLYSYIFLTTRRHLRANKGVANESSTYSKKEHRLAATLALVLVLFAVCWLPLFVMHTVRYYGHNVEIPFIAIDIGVILSHGNSAVNPIVYAFKIPKIREACCKLWMRLFHGTEHQPSKPNNAESSTYSHLDNSQSKISRNTKIAAAQESAL